MTTEQRYQKMIAAGIQPDSPEAKIFMASNETNEEAIERFTEELKASGKTINLTDNEKLLNESIKQTEHLIQQTEHLRSISNNVKFFFYVSVFSALLYFLIVYFS